jgi:hypothetical protein
MFRAEHFGVRWLDSALDLKMFRAEVRRASCVSSAGVRPARQLSFWPVAIEGAVEATKLSKPSVKRVA